MAFNFGNGLCFGARAKEKPAKLDPSKLTEDEIEYLSLIHI